MGIGKGSLKQRNLSTYTWSNMNEHVQKKRVAKKRKITFSLASFIVTLPFHYVWFIFDPTEDGS